MVTVGLRVLRRTPMKLFLHSVALRTVFRHCRHLVSLGCLCASTVQGQSRWEVKPSKTNASLNAVVFGSGLFVAVGNNGTVVTSPDGEVWTTRASGTTDRLPAIAFGNGRFVATRANRRVPAITSTDGIKWVPIRVTNSTGAAVESGAYEGIAFGNNGFMAVGSTSSVGSEVLKSADGLLFQTVIPAQYPAPGYLMGPLQRIGFCGGRFYGGDLSRGYYASTNGIEWFACSSGGVIATDQKSRVAILGFGSSFSIDGGNTFSPAVSPSDRYLRQPPIRSFTAACYGGGQFVAVEEAGCVWTSERGEYWLLRDCYAKAGEGFRGVAFDGVSRFVAVGTAPATGTALVATATLDPTPPPPGYTVYSLKDLTNGVFDGLPRAISNSGIIAGSVLQPNGPDAAAIVRDGKVTIYPDNVFHRYPSYATAVNDDGIAAAEVFTGYGPPLGKSSFGVALPAQAVIFPPPGTYISTAPSINSTGWIVGMYYSDPSHPSVYRYSAFTGERIDLGNFGLRIVETSSINDRGDIAGIYIEGNRLRLAYRMGADGQLTLVRSLGGDLIENVVMNSLGDVAGSSSLPDAPTIVNGTHAFLYRNGVTSDIDLFNSSYSTVSGINSNGDVVGEFTPASYQVAQTLGGNAFLYRNGVMYDLNRLLDASGDGWLLYHPTSINDKGWIVGQGWLHGDHLEPFLAIPNGGKPAGVQTRFVNVSTRLRTGTGDDVLIGGFIVRGGAKRVIIRALGPGLANTPNLLADPTLELLNGSGERIAFNDNFTDLPYWPDQNEIGGYGLKPPYPYSGDVVRDSVIAMTLSEGNYTAVVRGKDGSSGNCLVEVYNMDTDYTPGLINISTRGPVGTADDVMIAGFIVRGDRERRVLIRGTGPSLAGAGVPNPLLDPTLEVHDQNGQIAENDSWRSDQEAEITASGLSPKDDREASVILSLWPGSYTAIVRGRGNTSGNALVEVYQLPE